MPIGRLPLGLMAPVSLVVLVVALGALQYRWVGQVSERERDQLRQSLDRRAREFADDFDREIGRAYQSFRPEPGFVPTAPERFAKQYDEWLSASRFPGMIKTAYFASREGDDFSLSRYAPETRTFRTTDWPASLQPARIRLTTSLPHTMQAMSGGPTVVAITTSPVLPEVPAVMIPELRLGRSHVVLELDQEFISSTMLPALAELHFPATGADRFRVSVVNAKAERLLSRGLLAGQQLDAATADAAATFFGLRLEMFRSVVAAPMQAARFSMVIEEHTTSVAGAALRVPAGAGWTLLLQHSAGSLDQAVAQARRRNLWLSFGILGVLAASAGLIVINARRSEKLAAQQMDFVATVSHELRTPLAVIRSAAQNLSAGVVHEPGQAKRYGELIESEGRRLTDMVEQVLEYAGLSGNRRPPARRPVDATAIVSDVVSASASLPESEQVDFDLRIDGQVPPVMADEDAIRRALHNLIGNAMKYAGDGRWIGVTVAQGAGRDEGYVLVSVADRGRGIPAAELAHIFEPFYRGRFALERQIHGNGLGLNLVKRIVEAHGGRVTVKSAPHQGSTFTLHLPVAASPATDAARASTLDNPALNNPARPAGGHSA